MTPIHCIGVSPLMNACHVEFNCPDKMTEDFISKMLKDWGYDVAKVERMPGGTSTMKSFVLFGDNIDSDKLRKRIIDCSDFTFSPHA